MKSVGFAGSSRCIRRDNKHLVEGRFVIGDSLMVGHSRMDEGVKSTTMASGSLSDTVAAVFSESGALARAVDGYEPRDGQREMAPAGASVLEDRGTLLAEAGTGTGKTLAYLIPAILSRKRVLVSTGTKNLQEQIYFKDLPALAAVLDVPFTATLMKGRSNYLCLHRLDAFSDVEADQGADEPLGSERM